MKVSDIISRVRSTAGDAEVLQFKDSDILSWINDAMRECASDNNLLQVTATSNTVAGTNKYDVPGDILKLHSIRYDGDDLNVITLDEAQNRGYLSSSSGTSIATWIWAGKIVLFPAPDAAKVMEVDYTRTPVEVTGEADTPSIPVMYHMRIVDYCLAQVAQQDDDMQRYQMKMDEFKTGVASLKDMPEWENDQYPYMGISDRDAGDYYGQY